MKTERITTVEELKEKYPNIFSHPELKENEVWIGDCISEILSTKLMAFKKGGIKSARAGTTESIQESTDSLTNKKIKVSFFPIFANVKEVLNAGVK